MKKNIVCRKCRRSGEKLFLKGDKCLGPKCPFAKRPYAPGVHGQMRRRLSEYGTQLKEKQKAKNIFFLTEERFKRIFEKAQKDKGNAGLALVLGLEMRLDNIVFRLGMAQSRRLARQMITHGHILLNGKKVDIPSVKMKVNDEVSVNTKSLEKPLFIAVKELFGSKPVPGWLEQNEKDLSGKVKALPTREQMESLVDESAIIEYYSR